MTSKRMLTKVTKVTYALGVVFLLTGLLLSAVQFPVRADAGAVWTTNETCANPAAQDDNQYSVGETVHIRGKGFVNGTTYYYTVVGQPGSSDSKTIVASGTVVTYTDATNGEGYFCVAAYVVQSGDSGTYGVNVADNPEMRSSKQDSYIVRGAIPEPALALLKTATPLTYSAVGDIIGYTYVLTNIGNEPLDAPYTVSDDKATVTCPATPNPLPVGDSVTCTASYTITQADLDAGSVTNVAMGHASFGGNPVDSNQDSQTVTATQAPVLTLNKTVDPLTYAMVGDALSYSYELTNTGNVTLTTLSVSDDKVTVTCPAVSLAPGASVTCTASHTITQADLEAGYVTNIATAHGVFETTPVDSNQDTATATASQAPLLTLDKTVTETTYNAVGNVLHYSYLLTNTGNVLLTGFTVTDDKTAVDCSAAAISLLPGASTTCTATYTITQADLDAGSVTNTAEGHGFFGAIPVDSNLDSATVNAVQTRSLTLIKTADDPYYNHVGQIITYTYELINSGNVTLYPNFKVADDLTGVDVVCAQPASLAPGDSVFCADSYIITQVDIDAGSVTNIATGLAHYIAGNPNAHLFSNQDTATVPAQVPGPALSLLKTVTPATYDAVDDVLGYSYLLTNIGGVTLNGPFTVTDDKATVTCPATPTSLLPGEFITCTASYTITQTDLDAGSVVNVATGHAFTLAGAPLDSNPDTETATADQTAELTLLKTVTPATFGAVNDVLNYTYQLTNSGNVTLTGFTVTDDKVTVDCTAAATTLLPGASTTCTASYTITQTDIDAGSVTNLATGHGFFGDDPVNSNDDTETALVQIQGPSLVLLKTALPLTYNVVGDVISYSYVLTNNGNVTLSSPFTVTDDKSTDEACPVTPTSLAPLGTITCTATYTITLADLVAGSVTNIAQGHGYFGTTPVNSNQDDATVTAELVAPVVTITAENITSCAAVAGEECITFNVSITDLTVGTVEVFATLPATLAVEPQVFTADGVYQVTICGDWPGITDPALGVELELAGYAEWTVGEGDPVAVATGSAFVSYDPETMRGTCFPLNALILQKPFCYQDNGVWTMAVNLANPNDAPVDFAWTLNGGDLQTGTIGAGVTDLRLANLPLGRQHTIAVSWDGVVIDLTARLDLGNCQAPPPPLPPTDPIPVTAVEPPVAEAVVLIPVTGVDLSAFNGLGFFKSLMVYLGLSFLGMAFIVHGLRNRFK